MGDVVLAFGRRDGVEHLTDGLPQGFAAACCGFTQVRLQLAEGLLDRVEIGGVGRQEQEPCAALAHQFGGALALVEADIVEDDDVTRLQFGRQLRLE